MEHKIQVLPEHIANQIAAGEVIQRPASVLKELLENAIDAGATEIRIDLEDAGCSLIRVSDNGCGMNSYDARLAFERHATSKIKNSKDLYNLQTMGFRGEALASIASVAQVELTTRQADSEMGYFVELIGRDTPEIKKVAAPIGSTFTVRNLFYNVPARRRFLKTERIEMQHIMEQFERIALVYPEIQFSLYEGKRQVIALPSGTLKKRVCDTLGKGIEKNLLNVDFGNEIASIKGFVGHPESSKKSTAYQFFFVNGRYIKHSLFHRSINKAFESRIPIGYRPNYIIYFTVDPTKLDVNIHPTKTEVKFMDEHSINKLLYLAIQHTLNYTLSIPALDFNKENIVEIPVYKGRENSLNYEPDSYTNDNYNPFLDPTGKSNTASSSSSSKEWRNHSNEFHTNKDTFQSPANVVDSKSLEKNQTNYIIEGYNFNAFNTIPSNMVIAPNDDSEESPPLFNKDEITESYCFGGKDFASLAPTVITISNKFIITEMMSGLAIVDVEKANRRILYDEILDHFMSLKGVDNSQRLLVPEAFNVNFKEANILEKLLQPLSLFGFDISRLSNETYLLTAQPSFIKGECSQIILQSIRNLHESENDTTIQLAEELALNLTYSKCIELHSVSNVNEANKLLATLFSKPNNHIDPKGTLICRILGLDDIKALFEK